MALPNIVTPEFETKLPSNNQTIKFRPFLVKEEKVLLMAGEGKDQKEILATVVNILQNCIITSGVNVLTLPLFDIEWLFLQLRAKSVGEVIELRMRHVQDPDCKGETDIQVNVEDIQVTRHKDHNTVINLDSNIGITMKYPSLAEVGNNLENVTAEQTFEIIEKCVKNVFDSNKVYNDFTPNELKEFIGKLDQKQFKKIIEFFNTFPKLEHKVKYKCAKCGEEVEYTLTGLMDFFL